MTAPPDRNPAPGADEKALAEGLAGVIDRTLERHPAGETFVYGIHQHIGPGVIACVREHYLAAGWSRVALREGATGSHILVLTP